LAYLLHVKGEEMKKSAFTERKQYFTVELPKELQIEYYQNNLNRILEKNMCSLSEDSKKVTVNMSFEDFD